MSKERILTDEQDVAEVVTSYLGPIRTCGMAFMAAAERVTTTDVEACIPNDEPSALKRAFG